MTNMYTDPTPLEPKEPDYDQSKVSKPVKKHTSWIRTKMYGRHVREAISRGIEIIDLVAGEALDFSKRAFFKSEETENRLDNQIGSLTKDSEVIDSRLPEGKKQAFPNLKKRLDYSDKQKVNKNNLPINLGDYLTDNHLENLENFQRAIDDLPKSGGTIMIPPMMTNLQLTGTHPDYPDHQLVIAKPNVSIVMFSNGFVDEDSQFIEPMTTDILSVFYFTEKAINFYSSTLAISIKGRVDYGFYSEAFISRAFIFNTRVFNARKSAFKMHMYLSTLQKCEAHTFGESGFEILGNIVERNQGTSIQMLNCYSLSHSGIGYYLDTITYSSLVNCATDHTKVGYKLRNCVNVKLDYCGAERTLAPVVIENSPLVTVSGLSIPAMSEEQVENIISIHNSVVSISSLFVNGLKPKFKNKVKMTGTSFVSIEDRTIEPTDILNESTLSGSLDLKGYKASSIRNNPFKQGLMNGWSGDLEVYKNPIGQVELSGRLIAGQVTGPTMIAQLPINHYPRKNKAIQFIEANTGKTIVEAIYVTAQGGIYLSPNSNLTSKVTYEFEDIIF